MAEFDLVAIGTGPAGEKAAAQAAYAGYRVAVVDRGERPGGAPVNSGGIPTKALRETALYLTGFHRRDVYGIGLALSPELTLERLHARAAQVQETMARTVRRNLEWHGIELIRGEARLAGTGSVQIALADGGRRTVTAREILIATGSRPLRPASIPFDDPDVHDSDSILGMDRMPTSLVVIGGGPVGAEYASTFAALGVHVTLVDGADRLMPVLDDEISDLLAGAFRRAGMTVLLDSPGARVARVDGRLTVTLSDGHDLEPDMVLFAAGRVGNTEELGLTAAGVTCDARGRIVVDDEYRTSAPGIWAAGDVVGPPALASVSTEQGRVAACHAFDIPFKETVDPLAPVGVFTIPEVAQVGMTERAAATAGVDHEVGRSWFADNARSRIAGTTEGLVKLVLDRHDRRLLGVHVMGEEAAELIHQGQTAIHAGMPVDQFIHATFNLPTRAEAYKYAAYDALGRLDGTARPGRPGAGDRSRPEPELT